MSWKSNSERYGSISIGLHWLMLLLLACVYSCIELRVLFPKDSDPREALKMWHYMLGLSVFILVCVRLVIRAASGPAPGILPTPPWWQRALARAIHWALYGLMLGMPIGGWLILSSSGEPIPFFGLQLPPLVGENPDFAEWIEEIHETVGTVGYYLIGFHAIAALFHHYVIRDNSLRRMLPGTR